MPTGLFKQVVEIPVVSGLSQKFSPDVSPVGALFKLTNVELDKLGRAERRRGYTMMTEAALGSGSSFVGATIGIPRKIGTRQDELFVITQDAGFLGSGGGAGSSGDLIWSYSEALTAWKPQAKIGRPVVERFNGISSSANNPGHCDTSLVGDILVCAWLVKGSAGNEEGVYGCAFDVITGAVLLQPTRIVNGNQAKVLVQRVGTSVVVMVAAATTFSYSVIDTTNISAGFSVIDVITDPLSILGGLTEVWWTETDGTSLFLLALENEAGIFAPTIFSFSLAGSVLTKTGEVELRADTNGGGGWSLAYAGGRLHASWIETNGTQWRVVYASVATDLSGLTTTNVTAYAAPVLVNAHIAPLDADTAWVFWTEPATTAPGGSKVKWVKVTLGSTTPTAGSGSVLGWVSISAQPFVYDGHVYCPVVGVDVANEFQIDEGTAPAVYSGYGHALVEVPADTSGSGTIYQTAMPVCLWARDVSRGNSTAGAYAGSHAVVNTTAGLDVRYIATIRELRLIDFFGSEIGNSATGEPAPTDGTRTALCIDLMKIHMNHRNRWKHAEIGNYTVLAGGIPFAYDGLVAHECGFVFRPAILKLAQTTDVAGFLSGETVTYKMTYEWEDHFAGRWFSETSYPAQATIVDNNTHVTVTARPPVLTMKPLGGSHSFGRVKVALYRSVSAAPRDFQKVSEQWRLPYDTAPVVFDTDTGADLLERERAYIIGGELDNGCAPSCFSLVAHRDRLFAIDLESGKLRYTKPKNADRGVEWSSYQAVPIPGRGMALGSLEAALIIFCWRGLYALEGGGPASTGQPPDAFSHLTLLTQDHGCSEINAAWRCPAGLVFRTHQGLWLVTPTLSIEYIGSGIEADVALVDHFVDGTLDARRARLSLLARMLDTSYRIFHFWYDTGRWSQDTLGASAGTQYSSVFHAGDYYKVGDQGIYKLARASTSVYKDGDDTETYLMQIQTGFLRLGKMHEYKRTWRGFATAGAFLAPQAAGPGLDLSLAVESENGVSGSRVFPSQTMPRDGSDQTVRVHLARQKGKAQRLTFTEVECEETAGFANGPPGYSVSCLGLEFGVKPGGAKMPPARTQ